MQHPDRLRSQHADKFHIHGRSRQWPLCRDHIANTDGNQVFQSGLYFCRGGIVVELDGRYHLDNTGAEGVGGRARIQVSGSHRQGVNRDIRHRKHLVVNSHRERGWRGKLHSVSNLDRRRTRGQDLDCQRRVRRGRTLETQCKLPTIGITRHGDLLIFVSAMQVSRNCLGVQQRQCETAAIGTVGQCNSLHLVCGIVGRCIKSNRTGRLHLENLNSIQVRRRCGSVDSPHHLQGVGDIVDGNHSHHFFVSRPPVDDDVERLGSHEGVPKAVGHLGDVVNRDDRGGQQVVDRPVERGRYRRGV